jgi:hypothetical protein
MDDEETTWYSNGGYMNDRIKELAEQAFDKANNGTMTDIKIPKEFIEKFAQLIVRECIGVVEGGRFLHDEAPDARFARECSAAIKRHFGVEE